MSGRLSIGDDQFEQPRRRLQPARSTPIAIDMLALHFDDLRIRWVAFVTAVARYVRRPRCELRQFIVIDEVKLWTMADTTGAEYVLF